MIRSFDTVYLLLAYRLINEAKSWDGFQETRGILQSTGKRARVVSVVGPSFDLDMDDGFPILTTKFIDYRAGVGRQEWPMCPDAAGQHRLRRRWRAHRFF